MHDPVFQCLEEGRRRHASTVARVLILKSLAHRLQASVNRQLELAGSLLASVPSAQLVAHGSSFFWKAAAALSRSNDDLLDDVTSEFLAQAVDSFLPFWREGSTVTLLLPERRIALPTLGRVIESEAETVEVTISGPDGLKISRGRVRELARHALPAGSVLLLEWHTGLFETEYCHQLDPGAGETLGLQLEASLRVLQGLDTPTFDSVAQHVRWYVPLRTLKPREHRSLTSPQLPGVIFVSLALDSLRMAEAIVHEHAHTELNTLMDTERLLDCAPDRMFYSPWRSDPRPAFGLFHALYVFSKVSELWSNPGMAPECKAFAQARLRDIYWRLKIGRAQIGRNDVTGIGHDVLQYVDSTVESIQRTEPNSTMPAGLRGHHAEWLKRHPSLREQVVSPLELS